MLELLVLAILGVVMVTLLVLLVSAVLDIVLRGHDARAVGFSGIRCRHGPMFVALLILTSCLLFRNYRSEINKFISLFLKCIVLLLLKCIVCVCIHVVCVEF